MNNTKNTLVAILCAVAFALLGAGQALASVTVTAATGGGSISADTAADAPSPAWTSLGAITIAEYYNYDISAGTAVTLVLKTPAGFEFNTAVTPDITFTASRNITSAAVAMTDASTMTVTLSVVGTGQRDYLYIGSTTAIQVRPTVGTPLSTGLRIYRPSTGGGTATIAGITTGPSGTSFGALTEVAGAQTAFRLSAASSTPLAGATDALTIRAADQFGNTVTTYTGSHSLIFSGLGNAPAGTVPTVAGISLGTATAVTFTSGQNSSTANLLAYRAETATLAVTDGTFTTAGTGGTAAALIVGPAAANKLVMVTQPSLTATAGVAFAEQPVISIQDLYSNLRSSDTLTVTATRNAGAGSLLGTTNVAAVGGVATYTDLAHTLPTNITIRFTSGALAAATSSVVAVSAGALSQLLVVLPGETYAPGTVTGKTGTPTAQTAGTPFTVRVVAADAGYNTVTNVTDTVAITSTDATAVLPADAALINGTNSFTVTCRDAGSQTVTASNITDGITTGTSSAITINGGAVTKLQLLLPGETAAPGTPTGKTGTPSDQPSGASYTVTVNAVDANWNVVSSTHTVGITTTDPNDVLPANAALVAGTRTFAVTNRTAGTWTATATDITVGLTANTSPAFTVNIGAFAKLQILAPGEVAAPGTTTGKTAATPTTQNTDNPFTVTVNAVDANWNLVNTVSDTVGITSSDPNAALPSSAALHVGTGTFTVKFNTSGGTRTVTATDISDGTKTASISGAIPVSVGAFAGLQILLPGETAAPGTTTGKTGSATARTTGTAFNVTVRSVDASWNLISTNDTVHLASTDANATLAANTALASGTVSLSVTLRTVGSWTISASDVTHALIASDTSPAVTANVGAFARLQLLVPGETAAPGSASGKIGTPDPEVAGTGYSVTVNAVDANWNLISTNDMIAITGSDANDVLPANAALVAGTRTFSLTNRTAGSWTVTASDVTHTSITANTSPSITVTAGDFAKLQLLMPGETAAAGSTAGKTGTPSARTAGTAFNVTVNAVDDNWNVANTVTDTVDITCTDTNATLPSDAALAAGTRTFSVTLLTAGTATVTATDITDGTKTANTSPSTTVSAGTVTKLQLLLPGEVAAPGSASGKIGTPDVETAGTAFTVTVRSVDANWNLVSSTHVVGIDSTDANDVRQANTALSAGSRIFTITNRTAGTYTITATDTTTPYLTANTSPSYTVNVGAFAKLQILAPGEVAAPGTTTGKTAAAPTAQTVGTPLNATINAVDANWNLVNTVTDTVGITSSDSNASLQANTPLSGGTGNFTIVFQTSGSRTVTATDITDGTKTANTSAAITVNAAPFAKLQVLMPGETAAPGTLTGKTGSPTDRTAGAAFNVTVRSVDASWNLVSTNDTVHLASTDGQATLAANTALSAGTVSLSVTLRTAGSQTVTASDVTHAGIASDTGTSTTVDNGAATKLVIATQPSATATAGVVLDQQPVIQVQDAYNNICSTNSTVTATRSVGAGTLLGTTSVAAVAGTATYVNLAHPYATNITIAFTSPGLASATSSIVAVSPDSYSQLVVLAPGQTNAPGTLSGIGGTATAQTAGNPVTVRVMASDAYGNLLNSVTNMVAISSSDTNAALPADAALVDGTNSFSLTFMDAGSQTVTANDTTDGITTGTSSAITVNAGTLAKLQLLMPGETAAPGTPTGKTGTSNAQTAGTAFTVTVNGVDANWNVVPGASGTYHTIRITSSDANATLPANANLATGTQTFNVTFRTAGSATVTASHVDDPTRTPDTSPSTTVNVGAFTRLQLLMPGETAAPGTATGKTGTPLGQNTDNPLMVTVNAVDANWNVVDTVTDTVGLSSTDLNAALSPDAALVAGTQAFALKFNTAGSRTVTVTDITDGSKTANTSPAITVSSGALVKLQILMPGETAAPGTTTGKAGAPTARTAGTAFTVTVNTVDAMWNLVAINHTVSFTSSDAYATLPANTALGTDGTATFTTPLFRTAGSQTITVSDVTNPLITPATGAAATVNPGAFTKLQLIVPGETALPGSSTGKTGSPSTQTAGTAFTVTVNGVDANWNIINTNDTIRITSTDAAATLPANAALAAGTQTFGVTLATAPSATVTAANVTHTSITANTSPAVPISAAEAVAVRVETRADGAGVVVPAQNIAAGSSITNYAITRDTYGNFVANAAADAWSLINMTDGVVAGDLVPAPDGRSAIFTAHVTGTANIHVTAGTLSSVDSGLLTARAGAFAKLLLLLPGETVAPGTTTGKAGTPDARTAGVGYSVTVNGVDAYWNLTTNANGSSYTIHLTSTDANAALPADANLSFGVRTFALTNRTAGVRSVTASDLDDGTKTPSTASVTVNPAAFARLQLLVPGETAAPGTTTGKTGTPSAQAAGTPVNVTVNAVDALWNLIEGATDTINISCTDANATLPADAALAGGTGTFALTFKTSGSRTITATDLTDGTKTANTSPTITVNDGPFAKMQILVPGETAAPGTATGKLGTPNIQTAGTAFIATVNAVDADWNVVTSIHTAGVTTTDPNDTHPSNAALSAGTRTFSVTLRTVGEWTATASDITDGTKTPDTSPAITVVPGALTRLQLLVPGETAVPGSSTGKAGTPSAQAVGTAFNVTVRSVDANWNLVATNDVVRITSSDSGATLPENTALVAGSQTLAVTLNTAGSRTVTAANVTHTGITANTSPAITVNKGDQTIAFAPLANATYGDAPIAVSATASSGLAVSFSIVSGPATVVGSTLTITGAGDVTVRAAQAGNANWNAATNVDQSFNVAQATLVVGGIDQARAYGALNPPLVVGYFGFVNSDTASVLSGTPDVTTLADTNSPTGQYPIEVSAGTLGSANYSFSFTNGTLTVTQAVLSVTADDQSRAYGTANPELTVSYSGFVNGHDASILSGAPDISTTADASSPATTYPITLTQGTLAVSDTNYSLAFVDGTLTVTPVALTITADAATKVYGEPDPALTYQITSGSLLPGDSLTGNLSHGESQVVGTHAITQGDLTAGTNYAITFISADLTITARPLTVTANSRSKTYGQEVTFDGTEFTASGLAAGETVTSVTLDCAGAAATAAVSGSPYAIVPSNAAGIEPSNYDINYVSGSLTVNPVGLTVTGITADNKPFDGNTTATIHTESANLVGVVGGDDVTLVTTGAAGAFADAFPGTGKTVYISGLTLDGTSAGNYSLTQPTTTADIIGGVLTVAGIEAVSKAYDGTTNATLVLSSAVLVGVVSGDDVSLDTTNAIGAFEDKDVGTAKIVNITGLALFGADAGKYALTQPTTNADITAVALSVTGVTADSKPYDGNSTATLSGTAALTAGVVGSEDVSLAGDPAAAFDTKNVGTAKPVTVGGYTLAGADIGNYTLSQPADLTADITPIALSVTGVTADSKPYDGNSTATLAGTAALSAGVIGSEDVTLAGTVTATFDTKDIGTAKPVAVGGYTLAGVDSGNYTLSQPADLTADITAVALSVTGVTADSKPYDGNSTATLSGTAALSVGVVGSEDVTLAGTATATFDTKNVGTAKPVTAGGYTLAGADSGNYTLSQPADLTADITPVALSVTGVTADSKPYDGNTTATLSGTAALSTGVIGSEDVTLAGTVTATFDTKDIGTAKPVTVSGYTLAGADIGNYTLSQPEGLSADITALGLTVSGITANNKVYDGNSTATLNTGGASLEGVLSGDTVTLDASEAIGAFADAEAGTGKTVSVSGVTISGSSAGNYSLTQPTTTADIIPASSAIALGSSANPSPTGASVSLTATVSVVPPGGGIASGTVQFVVDGVPFGAPASLVAGVASLSSSALAHGSHTVAAEYAGNGNISGQTNSLSPDQLINSAPVGADTTMSAIKNQSTNLSATKLVLKCTDADDDAMTVTAVDASSVEGGIVLLSGTTITYTPPTNYTGADSFTYTVTDTFGGTGTGTVNVTVEAIQASLVIQDLTQQPDGNMQLKASGIPGETYLIQAGISVNSFSTIGTNTADANGIILFVDQNATNYTSRFYRLAAP